MTVEQADRLAKRIQPILEASDLANMLKPDEKVSPAFLIHSEIALIVQAISSEIRDIPKYDFMLWRLANRLLAVASLELRLLPVEFDRFVELVRAADDDPPDELLLWLRQHAMNSGRRFIAPSLASD